MVNTAFRYLSKKRWERFSQKEFKPTTRLIGVPSICRPGVPELPDWAHEGYIFAFADEPIPHEWKEYEHFDKIWPLLMDGIGDEVVVTKFDLLPTDVAYVVDRAFIADWQAGDNPDQTDAIRRYALSRIPARDYHGQFRLPELIIANQISLDRVVVHEEFRRFDHVGP